MEGQLKRTKIKVDTKRDNTEHWNIEVKKIYFWWSEINGFQINSKEEH